MGSKVYGCLIPSAFNYDPLADSDPQSDPTGNTPPCCLIAGCMDTDYAEYDPLACENDPTACITIINPPVQFCTGRTTLIPPGELSSFLYGPQNSLHTPCEEIEKHVSLAADDQRLYRYPMWSYGNYNYNAMWHLLFHVNPIATTNQSGVNSWTTSAWEPYVSGLLYPPKYSVQVILGENYNSVAFHCPEDFITWANTILDFQGSAITTTFTTDHATAFGTGYTAGGGSMVELVVQKINEPIANGGGGYEIGSPQQSGLQGDVSVFQSLATSEICLPGVNISSVI